MSVREGETKTSIELIKDCTEWDDFVDESPQSLLFHKWDFLKVMERYSSLRLFTYGINYGETTIGIFPLFIGRFKGIKSVFSPPPKLEIPYLGFIMSKDFEGFRQSKKEHFLKVVAREIDQEIENYSPDYLSITGVPRFTDMRHFRWSDYHIDPYFTYIHYLDRSLEDTWSGFKKEVRNNIKSAEKKGYDLRSEDDFSNLYDMLNKRYHEQNKVSPLRDKKYLEELCKLYSNIRIYNLYDRDGEVVNSIITQEYKNRVLLWMGSVRTSENTNEYVKWTLIQKARAEGYSELEEIGANTQNLCRFKSKFDPSLEMYININKRSLLGRIGQISFEKLSNSRLYELMEGALKNDSME